MSHPADPGSGPHRRRPAAPQQAAPPRCRDSPAPAGTAPGGSGAGAALQLQALRHRQGNRSHIRAESGTLPAEKQGVHRFCPCLIPGGWAEPEAPGPAPPAPEAAGDRRWGRADPGHRGHAGLSGGRPVAGRS